MILSSLLFAVALAQVCVQVSNPPQTADCYNCIASGCQYCKSAPTASAPESSSFYGCGEFNTQDQCGAVTLGGNVVMFTSTASLCACPSKLLAVPSSISQLWQPLVGQPLQDANGFVYFQFEVQGPAGVLVAPNDLTWKASLVIASQNLSVPSFDGPVAACAATTPNATGTITVTNMGIYNTATLPAGSFMMTVFAEPSGVGSPKSSSGANIQVCSEACPMPCQGLCDLTTTFCESSLNTSRCVNGFAKPPTCTNGTVATC